MIKDVFFPRTYGTYYLFSSRIVGVEINATEVVAVQIRAAGSHRTIEKIIITPLGPTAQTDHHAKAIDALRITLEKVDSYDELVTIIPSLYTIFKRVTVPFVDYDKIAQMINFEVEPLLPFPLSSAVVDFIITSTTPDAKSADIMVAAVQQERIARHISVFEAVGVQPTKITVDMFSLYALVHETPFYADKTGITALIHIGTHATGIVFMQDKQLMMMRTMPKGTAHIAKAIATARSINADVALEELFRFGLHKTDNTQQYEAIRNGLRDYIQEIAFTFNSVMFGTEKVQIAYLLGSGTVIPGLLTLFTDILQIPCDLFDVMEVVHDTPITLKSTVQLASPAVLALSAALPMPITAHFNLMPQTGTSSTLFIKQIVTTAVLIILVFAMLITHMYIQKHKLYKEATASEKEVMTALKGRFTQIEGTHIARVMEDATEELAKEEATWFAFSSRSRASMLKILLELKSKIDKDSLGFVIDSLSITEGSLIMKATVKDHNALKLLEQALRTSPLFAYVEPQTDTTFEMKITLAASTTEGA